MKSITDPILVKTGNIFSKKDIFLTKKNFFYLKNFLIKEFKIQEILTKNNIGKLNVDIILIPLKKYETELYFETIFSKINNINIRPGLIFLKKNIFKKGEKLDFFLKKNIFIKSKKNKDSNIKIDNFIYNIETNFYFPYFPFNIFNLKKYNFRSNIKLKLKIENYQNIIGINYLEYFWNTSYYSTHKINILNIIKKIKLYKNIIINNLEKKYYIKKFFFIKKKLLFNNKNQFFNKNFIINSISYFYNYNQFFDKKNRKPIFFSLKIEYSNNIFYLLNKYLYNKNNFFKIDIDLKKYWIFNKKKLLISHFFIGMVIPYNKDKEVMLNTKYFCNGMNDIRAWNMYSLGPGNIKKNSIFYSFSNIKIILNLEYRLKIISDTYIAFFIDAGNFWLLKSYLNNKKTIFKINNFYKQIALCSGIGIRYDLKYMIVRIDLSHKIIDPIKNYWNISLFNNNIINFAIGYPF